MERGLPYGWLDCGQSGATGKIARMSNTSKRAPQTIDSAEAFVRDNTHLMAPPLVPEIRLHLAEESVPIWQKSEEELGEMNVPPPFWAFAWAGGQALARYLLDHPALCNDQSVIDLGAGSGLTAIAAAKSGARSVLAADIDQFARTSCRLNAAANGVAVTVTGDDLLKMPATKAGVVLIGDLFYERALADQVIAYVDKAKALGAAVYIGDPQRSYFPRDRFTLLASYQVPVTRELEDSEIKKTAVWRA
ncbi:MAG: methyltransferase [Hyphomicrobium sp.]|nr:methyltransferase [Hyphomicrobium sp.]